MENGYSVLHNQQLFTVFSASYYCGTNFNKGAFVIFDPEMNHTFYPFYAENLVSLGSPTISNIEEKLQQETLDKLKERIFQSRHDLLLCFTHLDLERTGTITIEQWAQGMLSVLNLPIAWVTKKTLLFNKNSEEKFL